MKHFSLPFRRRPILAALAASVIMAGVLVGTAQSPAAAVVTSVKGSACGYITKVGLFGGPQAKLGCPPQQGTASVPATASSLSPMVELPPGGSSTAITAHDPDGAAGKYGPAVIFGGKWPPPVANAQPSGPITVSTQGTPAGGVVTSSAKIELHNPQPEVSCSEGFTPPCRAPGGFGPFPVEGDSLHVQCSASETSLTGSTTFVNATLATSTDGDGAPLTEEPVPNTPPVNYTRHGVITNVGDVFTVVYNEHIYNTDGSLTVNAAHMYLFGPTAVGEVIKGQATCGTTPSPASPPDTLAPSCGTPVVKPVGPENPTPQSPRQELIGVFDAGKGGSTGLQSITNVRVVNGTVTVPANGTGYLNFNPGQTGPLPISARRSDAAEAAGLPLVWSFDATDAAGNVSHCRGVLKSPPVPTNFDLDGLTDISVFRPSAATWFIRPSEGGPLKALAYGASDDIQVPADYDGDGKADIAIFRPSTGLWAVRGSLFGGDSLATYGINGDIPVPADYDGDGKADVAIFRPAAGLWWVHRSATNTDVATTFGINGDIPVPGDYDGDLKADLAVFRPSPGTWFVSGTTAGNSVLAYGTTGDVPVPGDYDGDAKVDIAIFRPSTGLWSIRKSTGGDTGVTYGISTDIPVPGDYDGDGKVDIGVFRPSFSTWYTRKSSTGTDVITTFGLSTDKPLQLLPSVRKAFYP